MPKSVLKAAARAQWRHPLLKRCFDWSATRLRGKDSVIKYGVGQGLRFNTGNSNAGFVLGTAEPAVQKVMQMLVRPGATVYDIGANVGFLSVIAARLAGPSGRVFAFEPLLANFNQIQHNARLNGFDNLTAIHLAVGDHDGTSVFITSKNPTWGKLSEVAGSIAEESGTVEVVVRRLDTVVSEQSLALPALIKIDVEGAEAQVFDGALETIRKAQPILMIELHGTNAAIAQRLKQIGYLAVVLGSSKSIEESRWDSYVIAFPARCPEMTEIENGSFEAR